MTSASHSRAIAVIGSFKQHNTDVQHACTELRAAGVDITSPQGAEILEAGIPFVRFSTDNESWSDPEIQSMALHRILRADAVYVVAPQGYIGRTTCYEVGRIIQHRQPVYFSDQPLDLPIQVPSGFVVKLNTFVEMVKNPAWKPLWLYDDELSNVAALERDLVLGRYRND